MLTIGKLPRWTSLLLILVIGVVITFCGQVFITGAVPLPSGGQITSCTLESKSDGGSNLVTLRLGSLSADASVSSALTDSNGKVIFGLKCDNKNNRSRSSRRSSSGQ